MYTIKQAAARVGLSVPLLRAWERRYGIVAPARTASGYRIYDEGAIARVRAMRRLVDSGWSPSAAAIAVRSGEVGRPGSSESAGAAAAGPRPSPARDALVEAFVVAAGAFDQGGLERTLDEMFASGSFEQAAGDYLLPAMVALGEAWAAGRLDVAAEHGATNAALRRLAAAYQAASRPVTGGSPVGPILVGLPAGSRHELGALAFSVAARRAGLPALYLGADLPADDWVRAAARTDAAGAVIGVVTRADAEAAERVADALQAAPPDLLVAFGGRAAAGPRDGAAQRARLRLPEDLVAAVDALAEALRAPERPGPARRARA